MNSTTGFDGEDRRQDWEREEQNGTTEAAPPLSPLQVPWDDDKAAPKAKRTRKPSKKKAAQATAEAAALITSIPGRVEQLAAGLSFGARTLTAIENLAESWGVTPATVANVALARGVNLLVEEDATRTKGG